MFILNEKIYFLLKLGNDQQTHYRVIFTKTQYTKTE